LRNIPAILLFLEVGMSNRERLRLNKLKFSVIRYFRAKRPIVLGKNEAMKIMLRKASGEAVRYTVAII